MSSSRRNSGEIHILAMLDGQAGKPKRFPGLPRGAWYGAGGVLACVLLGTAAWLMHDQTGGGFEGRIAAGPPMVPLEIASETLPNPALQIDEPRSHGAAIVDLPASAPEEAAPALRPRSEAPDLHEGQPVALTRPAIAPAGASVAKPLAHAAPRAVSRAAPAPRAAGGQARPEPAHPRRMNAVPKPKPAPATVDTDVALISAIIQHVNKRGELKDGADCGDKACVAKMPNRP
jgi:hypothetical protein